MKTTDLETLAHKLALDYHNARTDGELLASFIDEKDEAAFEALVRRHGPMVYGVQYDVARGEGKNPHAAIESHGAEDAI